MYNLSQFIFNNFCRGTGIFGELLIPTKMNVGDFSTEVKKLSLKNCSGALITK